MLGEESPLTRASLLLQIRDGTNQAASRIAGSDIRQALIGLASFAVMMVTASFMVFPVIWEE